MKRSNFITLALMLVPFLLAAQNPKAKNVNPTFPYSIQLLDTLWQGEELLIMVQVKDSVGQFVSGLADPNQKSPFFQAITDKGQKEICAKFSVDEVTEEDSPVPLNFSVVLDYSGSMSSFYQELQQAAQSFIDEMKQASFTRVNFDHNLDLIVPDPTRSPKSVQSDSYSKYGGGTALFGATDAGTLSLSNAKGSNHVVVFTDGYENASASLSGNFAYTASQLVTNARAANISIYAVGFDLGGYPLLNDICERTGGVYYDVSDVDNLADQFGQLRANNFANFYLVKAKCKNKGNGYSLQVADATSNTEKSVPVNIGKPGLPPDPGFSLGTFHYKVGTVKSTSKGYDDWIKRIASRMVTLLKDDPNLYIEIHGHASPDGEETDNAKLSFSRAKNVYDQITLYINENFDEDLEALMTMNRISFQFFGEKKPLYPVESYKNKENRRVEIVTIRK